MRASSKTLEQEIIVVSDAPEGGNRKRKRGQSDEPLTQASPNFGARMMPVANDPPASLSLSLAQARACVCV